MPATSKPPWRPSSWSSTCCWLFAPIVMHIIFPNRTTRYLNAFNGWLRAHGRAIAIVVLIVVGLIMVGNGIYGLTVIK